MLSESISAEDCAPDLSVIISFMFQMSLNPADCDPDLSVIISLMFQMSLNRADYTSDLCVFRAIVSCVSPVFGFSWDLFSCGHFTFSCV